MVLLLALAVHSIFETMALGLADTPLQAGLLALSIALHQPAESVALLVAFLKSGLPEADTFRYLSIFSAVGTIGVFLGKHESGNAYLFLPFQPHIAHHPACFSPTH